MMKDLTRRVAGLLLVAAVSALRGIPVHADSSSPRLAAYYDRKLLICGQTAYEWSGTESPTSVAMNVTQVGVGRNASYALTSTGRLLTWTDDPQEKREILKQVSWFTAGRSGVFAARADGTVVYIARSERWFKEGEIGRPKKVGASIATASIGDSADYFVTRDGRLYVKGLAHRGQYGDGKLTETETFIAVANDVASVKAHTGHAIILKRDGVVLGTGGNIYGPLGRHGIGDKAILWGAIFRDAVAIATGSSHSLAIRADGSLWQWGRDIGLDPVKILDGVVAAAADQGGSIALRDDGSLWQWDRGEPPERHFQCP